MPGLTITDQTYAGTVEASYMITKATFSMDTVKKGVVYVKDGIKKKHTIPKLTLDNLLQTPADEPVSNGTFEVTSVTLEPKQAMAYVRLNPNDFAEHFYAEQLSRTLLARELPVTAENVMMQLFLNKCFQAVERGMWVGSTSYTTGLTGSGANSQIKYFDGFIKKALVAGTYLAVGSPSAITSANIIAKLDAAIALLPTAILSDAMRFDKVKFILSPLDWQKFEQASLAFTNKGRDLNGLTIPNYRGFDIVVVAGLPENTFCLTKAFAGLESNLWIGSNAMEDLNIELAKWRSDSPLYFMKALFEFDTQIAEMTEFIMHTSLTTGSFNG
jgi:hypothetical protein